MASFMYGFDKNWRDYEDDGMAGEPLVHLASGNFGRMKASPGDVVYAVGQRHRRMILFGRLTIDELVDRATAEARLDMELIDKSHHALTDAPESVWRFDREVPEGVVRALRSDTGAKVKFASDHAYELVAQALMPMIRLTPPSAALLDGVLALDDTRATDEVTTFGGYQGRRTSEARRAIELRAVEVTIGRLVELGYDVRDVGAVKSFDLDCMRGNEVLHVEVKGSSGSGERVVLTANEVEHARTCGGEVALAIVSGIHLSLDGEGTPRACGGTLELWHPWQIDTGELVPSEYYYRPQR
jgi:hypothetical protein